MDRVFVYILAFCGLLALCLIVSLLNRRRLERKHAIPTENRRALEARLLDHVKARSGDKREAIQLFGFWRGESKPSLADGASTYGRRVPSVIRVQVVEQLIQERHIKLPDPPKESKGETGAQSSNFVDDVVELIGDLIRELGNALRDMYKHGFAIPPSAVRLTDSTFERMTHGATGHTIIGGFMQHNEGTFINSPPTMAGRDANTTQIGVGNDMSVDPFQSQVLDSLVDIFRRDAEAAPQPYRDQLHEVANGIEREAGKELPDTDEVLSRMQRAKRIVAAAGSILAASGEALKSWFELRSSL